VLIILELKLSSATIEKLEPGRLINGAPQADDPLKWKRQGREAGNRVDQLAPIRAFIRRKRSHLGQAPVNPRTFFKIDIQTPPLIIGILKARSFRRNAWRLTKARAAAPGSTAWTRLASTTASTKKPQLQIRWPPDGKNGSPAVYRRLPASSPVTANACATISQQTPGVARPRRWSASGLRRSRRLIPNGCGNLPKPMTLSAKNSLVLLRSPAFAPHCFFGSS